MSEDYARATGAPPTIVLNGLRYEVAKQGPRIAGELLEAIKRRYPDPRLMAREILRDLPDTASLKDVALRIWTDLSEEAKDWPPAVDSTKGNQFLAMTEEGAAAVLWALLRRHNPQLTFAKVEEIAADITNEQVVELIRLSMPAPDFSPKVPTVPEENRGPVPL